jgi:hypothetical protein
LVEKESFIHLNEKSVKTIFPTHLVSDSQWHWIDGTVVDNSVITWCPDSTYETAVGTQCAVYNTTSNCVTNYLCNTLLPAPCVASKFILFIYFTLI